jgi:hypothetical protein
MAKSTAIPLVVMIAGLCPGVGGVYGNPRPLRTQRNIATRRWSQSTVPPQRVHRPGKRQCRVLLPPRLVLEIDIGKRLSVGVADNEAGVLFLDGLGRREAAGGHLSTTS